MYNIYLLYRGHRKRHTAGQFNITCCTGDMCNAGDFPELPPLIYKGYSAKNNKCLIHIIKFEIYSL